MKSALLILFAFSLLSTRGLAQNRSIRDLPLAQRAAVNQLIEVQMQVNDYWAPMSDSFAVLDRMLPTRGSRNYFLKDWLLAITELAQETTALHQLHAEIGSEEFWKLGANGTRGGNGTFERWILTRDVRTSNLISLGSLFLPLHYAFARLSETDWKEFKKNFVRAVEESQVQLKKSQEALVARKISEKSAELAGSGFSENSKTAFMTKFAKGIREKSNPDFNASYLAAVSSNLLSDLRVINGWSVGQVPSAALIQQIQLRKMDFIEKVFEGSYLDQDQKNQIADDIGQRVRPLGQGPDEIETEKIVSKFFRFDGFMFRIQKLSTYLTAGRNDKNIAAEFARNVGIESAAKTCYGLFAPTN